MKAVVRLTLPFLLMGWAVPASAQCLYPYPEGCYHLDPCTRAQVAQAQALGRLDCSALASVVEQQRFAINHSFLMQYNAPLMNQPRFAPAFPPETLTPPSSQPSDGPEAPEDIESSRPGPIPIDLPQIMPDEHWPGSGAGLDDDLDSLSHPPRDYLEGPDGRAPETLRLP